MKDEPTKVPDPSRSIIALDIPIRLNRARRGHSGYCSSPTIVRAITEIYPSDVPQEDDMTFALIDIKA